MNKLCYIFNTETQSYQLKSVPSHINVFYKNQHIKSSPSSPSSPSYSSSTNSRVESLYAEYYSDSE